jgi:GNAT superfamily N-acetyltransferase
LEKESERNSVVEKLDISQKSEALGVLKQAFATHPMLPPGTPIETIEAMLELIIDSFGTTEKAHLYGIRKEGVLACVSFSVDPHCEPKGIAMIHFFFRLFRILGWRLTKDFAGALSKRPKYEDPYLDLTLLGTLPAYHGQGLGRTMLQFLYDFAQHTVFTSKRGLWWTKKSRWPVFRYAICDETMRGDDSHKGIGDARAERA